MDAAVLAQLLDQGDLQRAIDINLISEASAAKFCLHKPKQLELL